MIIERVGKHLRIKGATSWRSKLWMTPGFSKWRNGDFYCEPSRANVVFLHDQFPAATWDCDELEKHFELEKQEKNIRNRTVADSFEYEYRTEPFGHQRECLEISHSLEFYGLFMEMGTGKTKVLIDTCAWLFKQDLIDGVLLWAPNGVHNQFVDEQVEEHYPNLDEITRWAYSSGGNAQWKRWQKDFLGAPITADPRQLHILAMNVECMSVASGKETAMKWISKFPKNEKGKYRVLAAVDESTRIKNASSKRTKAIMSIGIRSSHRRILSGSPITRGVEDLYAQLRFLSPDVLGFNSFYTFRNRYCLMRQETYSGRAVQVIVGYRNLEELKRKIANWTYRKRREECIDLPPKIYMKREIQVSKEQRDLYNELRRELWLEIDGAEIDGSMAAVKLLKLQQILCGHIKDTLNDRVIDIKKVPRIEITRDLCEDHDGQVIVWARFTRDIDRLCDILEPLGVVRYDGKVPKHARRDVLDRFRSGDAKIFVGQPASAGLGLNLVGPTLVIYYSNSFDAEHRWQSEDRCHRIGTTQSVTYVDLVAPGIDRYILSALQNKRSVSEMTLDDVREALQEEI